MRQPSLPNCLLNMRSRENAIELHPISSMPGLESPEHFSNTGEPDEFKVDKHSPEINVSVEASIAKPSDDTMIGNFKWGQLKKMYAFSGFDFEGFLRTLSPDDRVKLQKLDDA